VASNIISSQIRCSDTFFGGKDLRFLEICGDIYIVDVRWP
jgi:hypothetical protein